MASPAEQVAASFDQAKSYADTATDTLSGFTTALSNSLYTPPTISSTWQTIAPPPVPPIQQAPVDPGLTFDMPDGAPEPLEPLEPDEPFEPFTEVDPTISLPSAPVINYGVLPVVPDVASIDMPLAPDIATIDTPSYLSVTVPGFAGVNLPDAPTVPSIATPSYLTLTTPSFAGVNLREDYLSKLDDIPTLELVAPTPYSYSPGPQYASALLDSLKAVLAQRMTGGTGLAPAVEQAIWDRARSRETQIALANEAEIMRGSEAMGFHLPTGALAAQLREAQRNYYDKLSGVSRDVAIKQAELEQENLKQTIAAGMEMEGRLIDYSYKLEQMTFEAAKTAADSAIQTYNAQVDNFKALVTAYQTYADAYDSIIKGEMAKVDAYKAQVDAEQAKAGMNSAMVEQYKAEVDASKIGVDIYRSQLEGERAKVDVYKAQIEGEQAKAAVNNTMVQQYKAAIEAGMSKVEIYRAQLGGAAALMELERAKIAAAGEQIRGYVAQVNAETAKVEGFKASVQAEVAKVDIYKTKADVFVAVSGVEIERAKAKVSRFNALAQAKTAEWESYRTAIQGESARVEAEGSIFRSKVDVYRASAIASEAQANMNARMWESNIRQYEAGQQLTIQTAKINGDFSLQASNARLDAAKVGAQVYAQLTSSAYGMINASASVSGSSSNGISYSYSGDAPDTSPTEF